MEKLITSADASIDITQTTESNPQAIELDLNLVGEANNAHALGFLRHVAQATTSDKAARATGLRDTLLVPRNLAHIDLDVAAHAINHPNWGWGMKAVQLEAERNRVGMGININVLGSTSGTNDPTYDPSMGMDSSTAELSQLSDVVAIRAEADARSFSNQASSYGINGGLASTDKVQLSGKLSQAPALRRALFTSGGDDRVTIHAQASNTGALQVGRRDQPGGPGRDFGKQRAVAIYNAIVDLGTGNDSVDLKSEVLLSNPFTPFRFDPKGGFQYNIKERFTLLPGASAIREQNELFDGPSSDTNDLIATGAADLYEAGLDAGDGNDNVSFYNGWNSDVVLGAGDDAVNLSAGKELFILGGAGIDTVNFVSREDVKQNYPNFTDPVYKGTQKIGSNTLHVVETFEGNVYLDSSVEILNINGALQALSPIKGLEPVTLSVIEGSLFEGGRIGVRVLRSGPLTSSTVVTVAIASGTAEEGKDFERQPPKQISFVPGQTEAVAEFTTINDSEIESDESIKVILSSPTDGAVISTLESVFVLTDNDKAPSKTLFSVQDATVEEGQPATIVVTRDGDIKEAQTVQITARAGTASALDAKLATLAASFLPDEKSVEILLDTLDDELQEATETIQIVGTALVNSGSAVTEWTKAKATLSITDNDAVKPMSTFKFKDSVLNVEEGKRVTIFVERTGDLSTNQIVQVKTIPTDSATADDFEEKIFTLAFPKGSTSQSFSIKTTADNKSDRNESFQVESGMVIDGGKVQGSWAQGGVQVNILEPVIVGKYNLATNENAVDEGATLSFNVSAEGLTAKAGTKVFYRISGEGITEADFEGGLLTGPIKVGSNGKVNFDFKRIVTKDFSSDEGDETAVIQIFEDKAFTKPLTNPAEVVINDTSIGDPDVITFGGAVQGFKMGTEAADKISIPKAQNNTSWALWGMGGKDTLVGGNKNDYLVGGDGIDTLTGGRGGDSFVLTDLDPKNMDTITDFSPKEDTLVIPVEILDASPDDVVEIVKYNEIRNQSTANKTFENKDAMHYVLVDTLANIKKANSLKFDKQIFLAVDTTNKKVMIDDDGNWFRGSSVLASLPKASMAGWTPNNFTLGFDFGGGLTEEDEVSQVTEPVVDELA